ncbi:MAG TPA: protein kinase [Pyrinomonadaceae bacterium]|nr:protein kinase [Pyrinomonadaceae bacterium]
MHLAPGIILGHYEIISPLGEGGMGEVYLAQDTNLNRPVALKVLPESVVGNEQRMRRFIQEAKAASALNHPNILTIYEINDSPSGKFIAMEFIEGQSLRALMKAPLSASHVLDIAIQTASALAAAHAAGIVHRDIKPENMMVRSDGLVKVLDFGLAKLTELRSDAVDAEAPTRAVNTEPGTVMGTLLYMSPEQARGQSLDQRTDIFSLGVVIYELLSGRLPFDGSNTNEILAAILSDRQPLPLARYTRECSVEFERIVDKALRKNRDERYQTSKDLLIDLRQLKEHMDFEAKLERSGVPDTRATSAASKRTNSFLKRGSTLWLSAALVIFGLAFFVYTWRSRGTPATASTPIKSLAVLPLKSLDAGQNDLGLGIADAVIRKVSQTGELIVRPTSAVRHYVSEETDALTAAHQLSTDAVLEGSVQRANDHLRVSVNLLRTVDGASLWADNFDMRMTDIFAIQDTVAQQVAAKLQLQLNSAQQTRLTKRSTTNAIAYEFYVKGMADVYELGYGDAGKPKVLNVIEFFKKAIAADPNYALAHSQLAYAYTWMALFIDPSEAAWADRAREEIKQAQTLDPQLAETHLARALLLWSAYDGWQIDAAIREVRLAQQIDPNVGHPDLAGLYQHAGLEKLAAYELDRALETNPTSPGIKGEFIDMAEIVRDYDRALTDRQRFFGESKPGVWYLMVKGRLDEAKRALDETEAKHPEDEELPEMWGVFFALKGDFRSAEAKIPEVLNRHPIKGPVYHHASYDIACIYAMEGKADEAVKWLKETAATGFPCYPLFARDPFLNRIRQSAAFVDFMNESKVKWEASRKEFGEQ